MTEHHNTDYEPHHASSPTDHVLQELALYGYRPFEDEPDPRPLPEGNVVAGSIADIFDALVMALSDTRLDPDRAHTLRQGRHRTVAGWIVVAGDIEPPQRRSSATMRC